MHGKALLKGRNRRVDTSCTVWAWLDVALGRYPIVAHCGDRNLLTRIAVGLSADHAAREFDRLAACGWFPGLTILSPRNSGTRA